MSEEIKMGTSKLRACAKCGNSPDLVDHRIRFTVICDCQVPANLAYGNSIGFLDHIEDDSVASIAFDAVNEQELMHSAINEWNTAQQLIEISNQNGNLTEENKRLREMLSLMTGFYASDLKEHGIEPKACRQYLKAKQLLSELDGE